MSEATLPARPLIEVPLKIATSTSPGTIRPTRCCGSSSSESSAWETKIAAAPSSSAAAPIATSTRGWVARSTKWRQRGCGASAARSIVIRSSAGRSWVTRVAAGIPPAGVPPGSGGATAVAPVISSSSVSAESSRRSLVLRFSAA